MVKAKPTRRDHHLRLVEYLLPGRWKVLVGRTDADNDYLSLKLARPDDWWFHVRGMPGGHVILQGPPGAEAGRDDLSPQGYLLASKDILFVPSGRSLPAAVASILALPAQLFA
jgi:predicted ribosome quality control (RQC) complex YloA/Tae2 family protein